MVNAVGVITRSAVCAWAGWATATSDAAISVGRTARAANRRRARLRVARTRISGSRTGGGHGRRPRNPRGGGGVVASRPAGTPASRVDRCHGWETSLSGGAYGIGGRASAVPARPAGCGGETPTTDSVRTTGSLLPRAHSSAPAVNVASVPSQRRRMRGRRDRSTGPVVVPGGAGRSETTGAGSAVSTRATGTGGIAQFVPPSYQPEPNVIPSLGLMMVMTVFLSRRTSRSRTSSRRSPAPRHAAIRPARCRDRCSRR